MFNELILEGYCFNDGVLEQMKSQARVKLMHIGLKIATMITA